MLKPFLVLLIFACGLFSARAQETSTGKDLNRQSQTSIRIRPPLDDQIAELSRQIANKIEAGQKQKIAVLEFTDLQGNVTDFGRYLSEELITRLYDSNKFKVLERQLLNKIIAEQKLSLTGVVDPDSAKKLGKISGVDAIVSGTIADRGESLKVNARLINSETGEIFSAAATDIAKDKEVVALMAGGSPDRKSPAPSRDSNKRVVGQVVSDDFTFELSGCRRSGQSVTCEFSIINNASEDRLLDLYADNYHISTKSSRLIDDKGNEYYPLTAWVGNGTGDANQGTCKLCPPTRQLWIKISLVPQVPTKASLRFEGVGANVNSISLLRITFNREGKPRTIRGPQFDYADFKSIPIE
jgi:TolB-like protein